MYQLQVESGFEAQHRVRLPNGRWEQSHPHRWVVCVHVEAETLDRFYMVADFHAIKQALDGVLADLDGAKLNDLPQFDGQVPTAEVVARYIYDRLSMDLARLPVELDSVAVQEGPGFWAVYMR